MKTCIVCGVPKPLSEFPISKKTQFRGTTGYVWVSTKCRPCVAEVAREYRRNNPGYSGSGKYTSVKPEDRYLMSALRARCTDAKSRANKSGSEFSLTGEILFDMFKAQQGKCAISGIPLTLNKGDPFVLSLDQVRAGAGYTPDNTRIVAWAVNRAKGDLNKEQFLYMCKSILERCNDYPEREYTQVSGSAQHSVE